jgi:ubiquinol-cytochrome c reductase cytochrome b subunit
MGRLRDWLEDRVGYRQPLERLLYEPVPGGARWRYVFGSALLFTFGVQLVTGVLLAFHYTPSATDAWSSVWYIQENVTLGWFLRGLHHFGAMAMVVLLAVHALQTFASGAYKKPRELNWIVGVLMAGIVLAFALTGYLLPWDQKGYYATKVATNMVGSVPLVGEALQQVIQGGNEYGQLTLPRFYALHVFVLPGLLLGLLGLHLWLFRRHGVAFPAHLAPEEAVRRAQPFWPHQAARDGLFALAVFAAIVALTVAYRGAPIFAPADPARPFDVARPEWYFLFLFQLMKYLPGDWEILTTVVLPGGALLFLCALPFLDRGPSRALAARKGFAAAFFGALAGVLALTGLALYEDAADPAFAEKIAAAEKEAAKFRALAHQGIPPEGPTALATPEEKAERLFADKCGTCHAYQGKGAKSAPDLTGWGTRAWIAAFLKNPKAPDKYGYEKSNFVKKGGMPDLKLSPQEIAALVEWIFEEAGEPHDRKLAAQGRKAFETGGCDMCHAYGKPFKAPNLQGWWSRTWLEKMLRDPADPNLFGERNQMKVPPLADGERKLLADWLLSLRKGR